MQIGFQNETEMVKTYNNIVSYFGNMVFEKKVRRSWVKYDFLKKPTFNNRF